MSNAIFNPIGASPSAADVARGLASMTGLPQKAIMNEIADSGLFGAHESNKVSADRLLNFLTNPRMIEIYVNMAEEQVSTMIRADQMLSVISPKTDTFTRLVTVMFKELNLTGMDQVDHLSPASIQTYNEFKRTVTTQTFKKQAKIIVNTLIRQLAGYDRDMSGANEVEREVLGLVGNLYTELVRNVLEAVRASILPYGYKVLGNRRTPPFIAIAEAIDATFMVGQLKPELAPATLAKLAQNLGTGTVNALVAPGMLDFWRHSMNPGREVDFISGNYSPEAGITYTVMSAEDVGTGQIVSRGEVTAGGTTVRLFEAVTPKVNSNDAGVSYLEAIRTVMGQFFTFPENNNGKLVAGPHAERVNNTVDVFIPANDKSVVYSLIDELGKTHTFNDAGDGPHHTLQATIDMMNGNSELRAEFGQALHGKPVGATSEGDRLSSKSYRSIPALVAFNHESRMFEFAKRLGDTNELDDQKLAQISAQLVAYANCECKNDVKTNIELVIEYLRDSVETEVTNDFLAALITANTVNTDTGPWALNVYGSLTLPRVTAPTGSGLPPLFHNIPGIQTVARERNIAASPWKVAGDRAYAVLTALKSIANSVAMINIDKTRDEMLEILLGLIYATEYKTAFPEGVFLRASSVVGAAAAGAPAARYQSVASVLNAYVDELGEAAATYDGAIAALENLAYVAPEVEILRALPDNDKRRVYMIALLDIATPDPADKRKKAVSESIKKVSAALVANYNEADGTKKNTQQAAINAYITGDQFEEEALAPYMDDGDLAVTGPPYALPAEPESDVLYSAAVITDFQALAELARAGDLDPGAGAFDALPDALGTILLEMNAAANQGGAVDGAVIRTNYVLAPLVSTKLLAEYANRAGANALALPAYEGITDVVLTAPLRGTPFKHNVPFHARHLVAQFALPAHDGAMDIDEDHNDIFGARFGIPLQVNGIAALGGDNEAGALFSRRVSAIINQSISGAAERVMAVVILSLPNTLNTHARLSKAGARLVNVALLRPFETNVLSLTSLSGLNGFSTLVSPTTFGAENHSQVSTMIMTMEKEFGTNVIDERRVGGICGFTSHRIVGGYNEYIVQSADDIGNIESGASVIAIAYPDTEDFALGKYLSLFNNLPIRTEGALKIDWRCKHPAAHHLNQRFPGLQEQVVLAETECVNITETIAVSAILSRGTTRHYNPTSDRYDKINVGIGAKSVTELNAPGAMGLMNGGIIANRGHNSDMTTGRLGYY